MATSKEDILKAIEEMSVMDLVDLISDIEEKFGVTAAAAVAAAPAAAGGGDAPAAEEKDSFDVVLSLDSKKLKIWLMEHQAQLKKVQAKMMLKLWLLS